MSTGVKAAAVAAFARVFLSALEPMIADWAPVLWVIAALTMVVGTVVGVAQTSLKRMLAYSSIAHGGYLLLGTRRGQRRRQGLDPVLPGGLCADQPRRLRHHRAARHRASAPTTTCATTPGCGTRIRRLATLMTMFLLSLGGFPPTAGFIAKWYVFSAAVGAGYYGLAIIGVLSSVVSVFFYLRIVVMMFMSERDARPRARAPITAVAMAGLAISLAPACCILGVLPARVLDWAQASVGTIF